MSSRRRTRAGAEASQHGTTESAHCSAETIARNEQRQGATEVRIASSRGMRVGQRAGRGPG